MTCFTQAKSFFTHLLTKKKKKKRKEKSFFIQRPALPTPHTPTQKKKKKSKITLYFSRWFLGNQTNPEINH